MTISFQAPGPFNGTLPIPSGMLVSYVRDPNKFPYAKYAQIVPAPDDIFSYVIADPDHNVRLVSLNKNDWADGAERPNGQDFEMRFKAATARTERRDFPWFLGNETQRQWLQRGGLDLRKLYDQSQASRAGIHRAQRILTALLNAAWPTANTNTIGGILGLNGTAYITQSSATEIIGGNPNPNYYLVRRAFQYIKQIIHLSTNGAVNGAEMICVMPPLVAKVLANIPEIIEAYKQSMFAKEVTNPTLSDWSLPEQYGGFRLVVEDTVRVFTNEVAAATVGADVTNPAAKGYMFNTDTMFFLSRPGGLMAEGLGTNFSTVQLWTWNGGEYVDAFTDAENRRIKGHVTTEDIALVPALASGFMLTDVLP